MQQNIQIIQIKIIQIMQYIRINHTDHTDHTHVCLNVLACFLNQHSHHVLGEKKSAEKHRFFFGVRSTARGPDAGVTVVPFLVVIGSRYTSALWKLLIARMLVL